jgi:hypothetical protein
VSRYLLRLVGLPLVGIVVLCGCGGGGSGGDDGSGNPPGGNPPAPTFVEFVHTAFAQPATAAPLPLPAAPFASLDAPATAFDDLLP